MTSRAPRSRRTGWKRLIVHLLRAVAVDLGRRSTRFVQRNSMHPTDVRALVALIAAARPVPGTTVDAHAWRVSGLAEHCQGVTVLGDGAYLNCGMVVPHRKRPHRPLLPGEEEDNAAHRKVRARVEHVIGRMKNYKILRDCQQRGEGLHHAVQAVALMHNLALALWPEDRDHRL